MRFFNLTLCSMLLYFQYPWFMVRYLAFNLGLKSNWVILLLMPLFVIGFLFYMTGIGLGLYFLRFKKVNDQDWIMSQLEKLRLDYSVSTLEDIKETLRKESIPLSLFVEEQKKLGIFASCY